MCMSKGGQQMINGGRHRNFPPFTHSFQRNASIKIHSLFSLGTLKWGKYQCMNDVSCLVIVLSRIIWKSKAFRRKIERREEKDETKLFSFIFYAKFNLKKIVLFFERNEMVWCLQKKMTAKIDGKSENIANRFFPQWKKQRIFFHFIRIWYKNCRRMQDGECTNWILHR